MLATVSARELAEWQAFEKLEPFGERRADLRAGTIAAVIYNANRSKDQPALHPDDFLVSDPAEALARQRARVAADVKAALGARAGG